MKFLLKMFVIFIILGVIVTIAGFAVMDFDIEQFKALAINDDDFTFVEKTFDVIPKTIETDLKNNEIIVEKSVDEKIRITYYVSDDYNKITCSDNEEVIKLTAEDKKFNLFDWKWVNISDKAYEVTIQLPESFGGKLSLKSTNGYIKVNNQDINEIDIDTTNSLIAIDFVKANIVKAKSTNGEIKVLNSQVLDTVNCKTTNGRINIKDTSAKKIELNTTNGKIDGENLVCPNINAKTTNGVVELSIKGNIDDYKIEYSTTNGKTHINGNSQSQSGTYNHHKDTKYYLYAKNTNGRIDIKFV